MIGGKFLKEWQVTDKIIESILSQFAFNHLWLTQTQKIITHRVLKFTNGYKGKFTNGYKGMCMSLDKIIEWFFYNSYFTFYKWLKLKK